MNVTVDSMDVAMDADAQMTNAELRALFDAAVDAIIVIDEQGLILAFNRAAERMFGHSAEAVLGSSVAILMPEPERSRHRRYVDSYLATGHASFIGTGREIEAVRADGQVFPVALSIGEAMSRGRRRFVAQVKDLSAQRAAEAHLRTLESRLAQVDRFGLMGEMTAGIAHEINQPLSAIASYAQAARRVLSREPVNLALISEICAKIDAQARRAGQVIQNLRDFIRRDSRQPVCLGVNEVIAEVRELMEADAHGAGVPIHFLYGSDLPAVWVDPVQLQQVLLNLTRNAVDAMRELEDKQGGIVVATMQEGAGVRVSVSDRGPGVSSALKGEIFHPFVTTKRTGLGVGLAISRTIMQSFGGTLGYGDRPGGGAVFTLVLPAAPPKGAAPSDA